MKYTVLLLGLVMHVSRSWEILFANVFVGGSHQTVAVYTANLLAAQGHNVTYLSGNIPKSLSPAVKRVPLKELELITNEMLGKAIVGLGDTISEKYENVKRMLGLCQVFYGAPEVQQLIKTAPKFDALVTAGFVYDACGLSLGHKLGIKTKILHIPAPAVAPAHVTELGLPIYKSSVNTFGAMFHCTEDAKDSVLLRAKNIVLSFLVTTFFDFLQRFFIAPDIYANVEGYPGYSAMVREVDLILLGHHPLTDMPVPFGPGVVSVSGATCKDLDPADFSDPDLNQFINSTEFIYFSFGSYINSVSEDHQQLLAAAFANVPYNVVWKTSSKDIKNLSPNVKTFKWLPQQSLLQHPNIKAFITHGGYASKIEASCGGVPLLVLPQFSPDQHENARGVIKHGTGDAVFYLDESNSDEIFNKIMKVATSGEIRRKAETLQRQLLATRVTDEQVLGYIDMAISGYKLMPGYQPPWEYLYLDIILIPILVILGIRYLVKLVVCAIRG